jgi:hypothetical protein
MNGKMTKMMKMTGKTMMMKTKTGKLGAFKVIITRNEE